jgi:hypothetical protein
MKLKIIVVLGACIIEWLQPQSNAQGVFTYLDNTSQPSAGTITVGSAFGMQFQTGTNAAAYTVNNIQLLFANASGDTDPSGLGILLTVDYLGGPGALVAFLQPSSNPTMAGFYPLTPQPVATLAGNTLYWLLVATVTGGNSYELNYANTTTAIASDGWFITGNTAFGQAGLPIFSIAATPVPEPSVLVLLITGVFLLILALRRVITHEPTKA